MKLAELALALTFAIGILCFISGEVPFPALDINAKAATAAFNVTLTTVDCYRESAAVPESGAVTFLNSSINNWIILITGLTAGETVNICVHTNVTPTGWEDAVTEGTAASKYVYFDLNYTDLDLESATIYFGVSQAALGTTSASNVRLFRYENSTWAAKTTTVVNSESDPEQFSAATNLSAQFLIGSVTAAAAAEAVSPTVSHGVSTEAVGAPTKEEPAPTFAPPPAKPAEAPLPEEAVVDYVLIGSLVALATIIALSLFLPHNIFRRKV